MCLGSQNSKKPKEVSPTKKNIIFNNVVDFPHIKVVNHYTLGVGGGGPQKNKCKVTLEKIRFDPLTGCNILNIFRYVLTALGGNK